MPEDLSHIWFPAVLNAAQLDIKFRKISTPEFAKVPFHDGRDEFLQKICKAVPFDDVLEGYESAPPHDFDRVILHQSFCGSTFLAKLLTVGGKAQSYREPQILIDLTEAENVPALIPSAILARFRFGPIGQAPAFVKPSNWVNSYLISKNILRAARLILIDIDLAEYLVANLRGGKDRIRYSLNLLNHALRFAPEWTAHVKAIQNDKAIDPLESTLRLLSVLHIIQSNDFLTLKLQNNSRVLALSLKDIQSRPLDSAGAAANWLGLDISAAELAARHEAISGLHAKSMTPRGFNLSIEAALNNNISQKFAQPLARTLSWAEGQRKIRAS